jgi:hypothetical protein
MFIPQRSPLTPLSKGKLALKKGGWGDQVLSEPYCPHSLNGGLEAHLAVAQNGYKRKYPIAH